jgi:hypothetical protein
VVFGECARGVGYVQIGCLVTTNEMFQFLERGAPRALRVTEGSGEVMALKRKSANPPFPSFYAIISCDTILCE